MHRVGLVTRDDLERTFDEIEPHIIRYPGVDAAVFRGAVESFVKALPGESA